MSPVPRYRPHAGPTVLSAGVRPFFLIAALWSFFVVSMSIAFIFGLADPLAAFPPTVWHAHEMAFSYGGAVVAGF